MYKVVIPQYVQEQLDEYLKIDGPHLRPHLSDLQNQLNGLRADPWSGSEVRKDFSNCWYIEVGDYRMYYLIDDNSQEVRFFHMERYYLGW